MGQRQLAGLRVMLSGSLPDELLCTPRADDLTNLMVVLVGGVLAAGGRLVFGGHPTLTALVHRVARKGVFRGQIELFQPAEFAAGALSQVHDSEVFGAVHWVEGADLEEQLQAMRQLMAARSQAAVFVGGKLAATSLTKKPGVRAEYECFTDTSPKGPAYLLGLLDGECRNMIHELEQRGGTEPNHLGESERHALHHSHDVDLIAALILADLQRQEGMAGY